MIRRKTVTKKFTNENSHKTTITLFKKSISESYYKTSGEDILIVKCEKESTIELDEITTEHIVIKSLSDVVIKHKNPIDEMYDEINMNNGSCIELCYVDDYFYILSSDGVRVGNETNSSQPG